MTAKTTTKKGMGVGRDRLAAAATLTTARASIFDSCAGWLLGTIDVTSRAAHSSPLMGALATCAARDIEQRQLRQHATRTLHAADGDTSELVLSGGSEVNGVL